LFVIGDIAELSEAGLQAASLLRTGDEPTPEFRRFLAGLALTSPSARLSLAGLDFEGEKVIDDRGVAEPLLSQLEEAGLIRRQGSSWRVVDDAKVLLVGPILDRGQTSGPDPDLLLAIGERGEQLSLRYESLRTGFRPIQVSKISAAYGYDLLSRAGEGTRQLAIEVKATSGSNLGLTWTRHEALVAEKLGSSYELQIWAEVDLSKEVGADYESLVRSGYPMRLRNPHRHAGPLFAGFLDWVSNAKGRWVPAAFYWELERTGTGTK
jgi:hypothetical protein